MTEKYLGAYNFKSFAVRDWWESVRCKDYLYRDNRIDTDQLKKLQRSIEADKIIKPEEREDCEQLSRIFLQNIKNQRRPQVNSCQKDACSIDQEQFLNFMQYKNQVVDAIEKIEFIKAKECSMEEKKFLEVLEKHFKLNGYDGGIVRISSLERKIVKTSAKADQPPSSRYVLKLDFIDKYQQSRPITYEADECFYDKDELLGLAEKLLLLEQETKTKKVYIVDRTYENPYKS